MRVLILRRQGDERVGAREVVEAALDGRQILDGLNGNVASRTGARRADQRIRLADHRHRLRDGLQIQLVGQTGHLTQVDVDIRRLLRMKPFQADRNGVWTARADILDAEPSLRIGDGRIPRPRGLMDGLDIDARQHGIVRVAHDTAQGTGGGLSEGHARAERQSEEYCGSGCESHGSPPKRKIRGEI